MPFSVKIDLGSEHSIVFEVWIEECFGKYVPKGTGFARASGPDGLGVIVTNGPVFLSSHPSFVAGEKIAPGAYVAYGAADGEDIPYGKPYCVFVPDAMKQLDIKHLFSEPGRRWNAKSGATEAEISALIAGARVTLPVEYLDLLRYSNGGEGPLDLPPLWFALYSSMECIELFHSNQDLLADFPDFLFFGGNGGLETIGFDLRTAHPWRIVMVDAIAGPSSCTEIAADISTFIRKIGIAAT